MLWILAGLFCVLLVFVVVRAAFLWYVAFCSFWPCTTRHEKECYDGIFHFCSSGTCFVSYIVLACFVPVQMVLLFPGKPCIRV